MLRYAAAAGGDWGLETGSRGTYAGVEAMRVKSVQEHPGDQAVSLCTG